MKFNINLSKEEIKYLMDFLENEIENWPCPWIEYKINEEDYNKSKELYKKLKEVLDK